MKLVEVVCVRTAIGVTERAKSPNSFGSPQGYGIGLVLTKHIVELHGGTIRAYSHGLRRGSSVVVRLPVA